MSLYYPQGYPREIGCAFHGAGEAGRIDWILFFSISRMKILKRNRLWRAYRLC